MTLTSYIYKDPNCPNKRCEGGVIPLIEGATTGYLCAHCNGTIMHQQIRLKDLPELSRMHLAWVLDHKTYCGYLTASAIGGLRTEWANEMSLIDILLKFEITEKQAKVWCTRIVNFRHKP